MLCGVPAPRPASGLAQVACRKAHLSISGQGSAPKVSTSAFSAHDLSVRQPACAISSEVGAWQSGSSA